MRCNNYRRDRTIIFHENAVRSAAYLDMPENYVVPQVPKQYVFQRDGAPPHFWTLGTDSSMRDSGERGSVVLASSIAEFDFLYFYLRGCLKDAEYRTKVNNDLH
jgi:hypothetical protein